jgi:hypothetical protein
MLVAVSITCYYLLASDYADGLFSRSLDFVPFDRLVREVSVR